MRTVAYPSAALAPGCAGAGRAIAQACRRAARRYHTPAAATRTALGGTCSRSSALSSTLANMAPMAMAMLPLTARARRESNLWVQITSQGGVSPFASNHPRRPALG